MKIVEVILWVFGVLLAVGWGFSIRNKARNEQATEHVFELFALLLALSIIIIPVFSLSAFHLLWMVPASFALSLISMIPPLNLLWLPASLYARLWYLGVYDAGRVQYLAGNYAEAIEEFNKTIKSKPDSVWAHFNLGCSYSKLGDKQKALDSFQSAIHLTPNFSQAHNNLGLTQKDLGQFQDAKESFKRAISIQSDYDAARWNLGMLYVETDEMDSAMIEYEALKKSDPVHADELLSSINAKIAQTVEQTDD